jgi:hypothetical protein
VGDEVVGVERLGFPWRTNDPFLFCVHHEDAYPAGDEGLGPAAPLAGRDLGQDFAGVDGWRMYHGRTVPGFPQHPHRGFETVTVVRRGLVDHADSLGAAARYGQGDVQWLTAGRGVVHSEMFPLLERAAPNPLELFQIWLNLPRDGKRAEPHFQMLWKDDIPRPTQRDAECRETRIAIVAGRLGDVEAPAPPPGSWAARRDADVAIWTLRMDPQARWTLPAAGPRTGRTLYYFRGSGLDAGGSRLEASTAATLAPGRAVELRNGPEPAELLLLQGRPIGEPVVQYGPFVMNSAEEIEQTFAEYHRTGFGGWPWPSDDPVHPRDAGRFARRPGGEVETPDARSA